MSDSGSVPKAIEGKLEACLPGVGPSAELWPVQAFVGQSLF